MFKSRCGSVKCSSRLGEAPRELRCAPYACGTGFTEFYDRGMKNTAPRGLRCAPYAYGTGFTEFYAMRNKKTRHTVWYTVFFEFIKQNRTLNRILKLRNDNGFSVFHG